MFVASMTASWPGSTTMILGLVSPSIVIRRPSAQGPSNTRALSVTETAWSVVLAMTMLACERSIVQKVPAGAVSTPMEAPSTSAMTGGGSGVFGAGSSSWIKRRLDRTIPRATVRAASAECRVMTNEPTPVTEVFRVPPATFDR